MWRSKNKHRYLPWNKPRLREFGSRVSELNSMEHFGTCVCLRGRTLCTIESCWQTRCPLRCNSAVQGSGHSFTDLRYLYKGATGCASCTRTETFIHSIVPASTRYSGFQHKTASRRTRTAKSVRGWAVLYGKSHMANRASTAAFSYGREHRRIVDENSYPIR